MAGLEHFTTWLDEILTTASRMLPHTSSYQKYVDRGEFRGWSAQSESFLTELVGSSHVYYTRFATVANRNIDTTWTSFQECVSILSSVKDDLTKGRLISLKAMITAEVFSDFLEMAEHLLLHDYKDASASLIGAVLERGLRDLATANGLTVRDRDDLTSLTNKLAEKHVFNRLVQKNLNVWIEVRNNADHGKFEEYAPSDVKNMLVGVQAFLSQNGH